MWVRAVLFSTLTLTAPAHAGFSGVMLSASEKVFTCAQLLTAIKQTRPLAAEYELPILSSDIDTSIEQMLNQQHKYNSVDLILAFLKSQGQEVLLAALGPSTVVRSGSFVHRRLHDELNWKYKLNGEIKLTARIKKWQDIFEVKRSILQFSSELFQMYENQKLWRLRGLKSQLQVASTKISDLPLLSSEEQLLSHFFVELPEQWAREFIGTLNAQKEAILQLSQRMRMQTWVTAPQAPQSVGWQKTKWYLGFIFRVSLIAFLTEQTIDYAPYAPEIVAEVPNVVHALLEDQEVQNNEAKIYAQRDEIYARNTLEQIRRTVLTRIQSLETQIQECVDAEQLAKLQRDLDSLRAEYKEFIDARNVDSSSR